MRTQAAQQDRLAVPAADGHDTRATVAQAMAIHEIDELIIGRESRGERLI